MIDNEMRNKVKRIKITNRGMFSTSRGRFIAPLGPYNEKLGYIFAMITKERANIVEILPDGTEIPLDINNFDKDNSVKTETVEIKENNVVKPEVVNKPIVKESNVKPEKNEENKTAQKLSRKEQKKLDYEQRMAEKAKKESEDSKVDEAKPSDTTVPDDAIES